MSWLDPLREALAAATSPPVFFFRDDDGGWANDRLAALLERFARAGAPVDVAVIPAALDAELAALTIGRPGVGVHQHGFAHRNHEPEGRRCEFGPARRPSEIRRDLIAGRRLLLDAYGQSLDPIFTPPWNRCTPAAAALAAEAGFAALSRDASAPPADLPGLAEIPVTLDWFAHRKGVRLAPAELGRRLAEQARAGGPVGVMLHHAAMDGAQLDSLDELLAAVVAGARCVPMRELRPDLGRVGVA
ncbi:MAG: hypothetical protein ACKVWR_15240 [Acidimicrobiales bacterium]